MRHCQKILVATALTFALSVMASGGTITGSKVNAVGTITGSRAGTITGSKVGTITGSQVGRITGSRVQTSRMNTHDAVLATDDWLPFLVTFLCNLYQ